MTDQPSLYDQDADPRDETEDEDGFDPNEPVADYDFERGQ
jgi:hypothetical protein